MLGKLDESAPVYIIAIVLLIGMLIISNMFFPAVKEETDIVASLEIGLVGSVSNEPAIIKSLGSFSVGETHSVELKSFPRMVVQQGYFGEDRKEIEITAPEEFLEKTRGARMVFTVSDTNRYGNLTIKWNGRPVFSGRPSTGSKNVFIPPEAVKKENRVEIFADPPGLFFWASTAYVIRNFEAKLEYGPDMIVPFEISPSELQAFSKGAIRFSSVSGVLDRLVISVNGKKIYDRVPRATDSAEFDLLDTTISPGVNVITFSAPDMTVSLNNVRLEIFLNTNSIVRKRTFRLEESQKNSVSQNLAVPRLSYTVKEIRRPGALIIKINDIQLPGVFSQRGENFIDIPPESLHAGENTIEFSSTGTFIVSEAKILLKGME